MFLFRCASLAPFSVCLVCLLAPAAGCSSAPSTEASSTSAADTSGSTVAVRGRPNFAGVFPGDNYCWALRDDFDVTYTNRGLPAGARVFLHYGPETGGNCSDCNPTVSYYPWSSVQETEPTESGNGTWH